MSHPVQTRDELLQRLRRHRGEFESLGVEQFRLFGSFARDEVGPNSDVDLLVNFREGDKTFRHFMDLSNRLESLLGRSVEVVTPESLDRDFALAIEEELHDVFDEGSGAVSPGRTR